MAEIYHMPGPERGERPPQDYWVIFQNPGDKNKAYELVRVDQKRQDGLFGEAGFGGANLFDEQNASGLQLFFPGAAGNLSGALEQFFTSRGLAVQKVSSQPPQEFYKAA